MIILLLITTILTTFASFYIYFFKYKALKNRKKQLSYSLKTSTGNNTRLNLAGNDRTKIERFKMVTVLFSDIQGFSELIEEKEPYNLINELDKFFLFFDTIVEKYNIEKIKTIGDAYMCAGGIPKKNRTNPLEVILAALEIKQYMKSLKDSHKSKKNNFWDIRIGIHTGHVIAGSLGKKKIIYDIWGDTVNIASRMEAASDIGEINITATTYDLVKEFFICEHRGKMPIKYKGSIDMYNVIGLKPKFTKNKLKIQPNKKFIAQLQLIRYEDLEENILAKIQQELPKKLYYHNLKHTIDVCTQVEVIGNQENVTQEELLLLKTAALFHDLGFIKTYLGHEEIGIQYAKKILPKYFYTDKQIHKIEELIVATKFPPAPKNLLEKIICDADLDYLGRKDFLPVSNDLYRELKERRYVKSIKEWNNMQIAFIEKHQYYTKTGRNLREVNKIKQLKDIKNYIQ